MAQESQPTGYRIIQPHGIAYESSIFLQRESAKYIVPEPFGAGVMKSAFALHQRVESETISVGDTARELARIAASPRYLIQSYWEDLHDYPEILRGFEHLWEEAMSTPEVRGLIHFENSFLRTSKYPQDREAYEKGDFGAYHLTIPDVVDDEALVAILINHNRKFVERQRAFEERLPRLREAFLQGMQTLAANGRITNFDLANASAKINLLQIDFVDEIPAQQLLAGPYAPYSLSTSKVFFDSSDTDTTEKRLADIKRANITMGVIGEHAEFHLATAGEPTSLIADGYNPDVGRVIISALGTPEEEDKMLFEQFTFALAGKRAKEVAHVSTNGEELQIAQQRRIAHDRVGHAMLDKSGSRIFFRHLSSATNRLLAHRAMNAALDPKPKYWDQSNSHVFFLQRVLAPLGSRAEQLLFDAYLTDNPTPNTSWMELNRLLNEYYGSGFLGRLDAFMQNEAVYGFKTDITDKWLRELKKPAKKRRIAM